jgi:hypothetical protein
MTTGINAQIAAEMSKALERLDADDEPSGVIHVLKTGCRCQDLSATPGHVAHCTAAPGVRMITGASYMSCCRYPASLCTRYSLLVSVWWSSH